VPTPRGTTAIRSDDIVTVPSRRGNTDGVVEAFVWDGTASPN